MRSRTLYELRNSIENSSIYSERFEHFRELPALKRIRNISAFFLKKLIAAPIEDLSPDGVVAVLNKKLADNKLHHLSFHAKTMKIMNDYYRVEYSDTELSNYFNDLPFEMGI